MHCYLIRGGGRKRYAGTQTDAHSIRNMIVEETGAKKKDVMIEKTEVPVIKAELINFINSLCAELDEQGSKE